MTSLVDEAHQTDEIAIRIQEAVRFAFGHFKSLFSERYGVRWMDMYMLGDRPVDAPWD